MTVTQPDVWNGETARGWYQSTCPYVPAKPFTPRSNTQSGLSSPSLVAWRLCGTAATVLPMQLQPITYGPESTKPGIDLEDWDLMFRAVLETLSRSPVDKSARGSLAYRMQPPGDVMEECLVALDRLRTCVPIALPLRTE